MKFRWTHKRMVHVHAKPWDDVQENIIHVVKNEASPLMLGTILTQPQTSDPETDALLTPGTQVLFSVVNKHNQTVVEPIDGQQIMDEGEYFVLGGALLGILTEESAA